MSILIACLSNPETWIDVQKLINTKEFAMIYLVCNQWTKDNYQNPNNAELVLIDEKKSISENAEKIVSALQGKIQELDVGVNLISGTGAEHMAILSAVIKLGVGMRFVTADQQGIKEL